MKSWLIFSGLIVVAIAGVAWYVVKSAMPVQTARAEPGEIREFVDERARTRLPREHLITMPFAGRIEEIAAVEGQRVGPNDERPLAKIVPLDIEYSVDEARAVVERLAAAIRRNKDHTVELTTQQQAFEFVKSMAATVKAADTRMESGKARLDYALKHLARVEGLGREGAESQDVVEQARVSRVEADVDYQQDRLVAEAMKSIEAATRLLPKLVGDYIDRRTQNLAVLENEQAEAQARLNQTLIQQRRSEMRSPIDGVVLDRHVSNERYLPAGEVLVRVGRLEELEIETDVLSEDAVQIREGDPVEIYGASLGRLAGDGLPGKVARIHPAGFTKISSLGVEQQRVKVIVAFDDAVREHLLGHNVGVDYRVRVRIFTDAKQDVIVVPRSALFRNAASQWQVFAVHGGKAALRDVQVGLMNDDLAEITAGLTTGEQVILAPEASLIDGTRVRPEGGANG